MNLIRKRIGDLIRIVDEKNINNFDYPFFGININKEFMPSVANTDNVDRKKYKIICKNRFVFSGMQTGRDNCIRIGLYDKDDCVLVSPAYTTFEVVSQEILPEYLFMIFNSKEEDRYGSFLSDSSVRANLDWDRFCDIELDLPPIEIQKKYVAIYESMLKNLHTYEKGLDDLKLVCDGYIEKLRDKEPVKLEGYIHEISNKNEDGRAKLEMGVSINKEFILTKAKSSNIENQKVVATGQFAYNSNTSRNSDAISLALNISNDNYAVSNTYITFECDERLNPKYLYLWFKRKEFDRFARFNSWGSARETIGIDELSQSKIAIPEMMIQNNIVKILKIYNYRKSVVEKMKLKIKNICPILIRGSIKECEKGA